jgi:hypothetical protein
MLINVVLILVEFIILYVVAFICNKGLLELYTTQIQPDPFGCLSCIDIIELIERYEAG